MDFEPVPVKNFFQNEEKNTFGFILKSVDLENNLIISIAGDFEFKISPNYVVSTKDDFLDEICDQVNKNIYATLEEVLVACTQEYARMLGLYDHPVNSIEEETVDICDNDLSDIKFVDRIRFKDGDFNQDLIYHIFEFLWPNDILKFGLVCKTWYDIASNDTLWKAICQKCGFLENPERVSWRSLYKEKKYWEWNQGNAVTGMVKVDQFSVESDQYVGEWRTVRTLRGCKNGQKVSMAIYVDVMVVQGYCTFGVIDSGWDYSKHSATHGGVVMFASHLHKTVGVVIDRTVYPPTISYYVENLYSATHQIVSLDPNSVWYPAFSCKFSQKCTIVPDWKPKLKLN